MIFSNEALNTPANKHFPTKPFCMAIIGFTYGYNRIHMTNHFLSDVGFGTLITYLIFAAGRAAFGGI